MRFRDRRDAGPVGGKARTVCGRPDVVVLALPRGGLPVGLEVATRLGMPLDVFVVRKFGVPGNEGLAMGASGGTRVLNEVIGPLHIPESVIDATADRERRELARCERLYRDDCPILDVKGRTMLLVDDGLATGSTMRAAIHGTT